MENQHLRRLIARTRTERLKAPSSSFCASLGRTPNDGGGLLPPGRAARISLFISDLGIFRVTKTATLISVKQLIHSNLHVAPQNAETLADFPWTNVQDC